MLKPYQPTLHRLPEDTAGRFRVLREFLSNWHGLDTGTIGRTVDRVGEAEALLQRKLPLAVRCHAPRLPATGYYPVPTAFIERIDEMLGDRRS